MTKQDFARIASMLTANFPFLDLKDKGNYDFWADMLAKYDTDDVSAGVRNYIAWSNKQPTIADIISEIKTVSSRREREQVDYNYSNTVKCPKCQDRGYIRYIYHRGYKDIYSLRGDNVRTIEDCIETFSPCNCETGKARFSQEIQPRAWTDKDLALYFNINENEVRNYKLVEEEEWIQKERKDKDFLNDIGKPELIIRRKLVRR